MQDTCAVLSWENYQEVYTAELESSLWVTPEKPKEFPEYGAGQSTWMHEAEGSGERRRAVNKALKPSYGGEMMTIEDLQALLAGLAFLSLLSKAIQRRSWLLASKALPNPTPISYG